MRRGTNLGAVLLLVAGAGLFVRCLPRRPGQPTARARTMQLVSDLQKAIKQYQLDHGVYPTLTPGQPMTEEQGMTCLFQLLLRGPTIYFDFQDRQIVGGLAGVAGEGARPAEPDLPLGAIVDAWGRGLRYREHRSVQRRRPAAVRGPKLSYELFSLGKDGLGRTADDVTRSVQPATPAPTRRPWSEDGRRLGMLASIVMLLAGIAGLFRRRGIVRRAYLPISSGS